MHVFPLIGDTLKPVFRKVKHSVVKKHRTLKNTICTIKVKPDIGTNTRRPCVFLRFLYENRKNTASKNARYLSQNYKLRVSI